MRLVLLSASLLSSAALLAPGAVATNLFAVGEDTSTDQDKGRFLPSRRVDAPSPTPSLSAFFLEDAPRARPVAALEASLDLSSRQVSVIIDAAAPFVDPPRGLQYRSDVNPITARELTQLIRERRVSIQSRSNDGTVHTGTIHPGPRVHLQRRVLSPRAQFRLEEWPDPVSVRTEFRSPALGNGEWTTEVLVDGIPRIRVVSSIATGNSGLRSLESLAHPAPSLILTDPAHAGLLATLPPPPRNWSFDDDNQFPDQAKPQLNPELQRLWPSLDMEHRWLRIIATVNHGNSQETALLYQFLREQREHEILGWLAIYRGDRSALSILIQDDAPNWAAITTWMLYQPDSHTIETAERHLLHTKPAAALAWLELHDVGEDDERARRIRTTLAAQDHPTVDVHHLDPPLTPVLVFPHLEAPAELLSLEPEHQTLPGTRYRHQVLRSIDGLIHSGRVDDARVEQLLTLTHHDDEAVRAKAFSVFTGLPAHRVPVAALLERARDDLTEDTDRKFAWLAVSYSDHPEIWARLHEIAESPDRPAWEVAVQRLGDLGNQTSAKLLRSLENLDSTQSDARKIALERIDERLAALKPEVIAAQARTMLERIAWVDLHCHPLELTDLPATLELLKQHATNAIVRDQLRKLATEYVPDDHLQADSQWGSLQERVRLYASQLLE